MFDQINLFKTVDNKSLVSVHERIVWTTHGNRVAKPMLKGTKTLQVNKLFLSYFFSLYVLEIPEP